MECHIPYRLEFLRRGSAMASEPWDPAVMETALLAGRQLILFLGFGIEFSADGRPRLEDRKRAVTTNTITEAPNTRTK